MKRAAVEELLRHTTPPGRFRIWRKLLAARTSVWWRGLWYRCEQLDVPFETAEVLPYQHAFACARPPALFHARQLFVARREHFTLGALLVDNRKQLVPAGPIQARCRGAEQEPSLAILVDECPAGARIEVLIGSYAANTVTFHAVLRGHVFHPRFGVLSRLLSRPRRGLPVRWSRRTSSTDAEV